MLSGACRLLVEGSEQLLEPWDFFHCPAGTEHIFLGRRRQAVRDPDGRCAIAGRTASLPGVRARGALRRERRRGDRRPGPGVHACGFRAVAASAALVLATPSLELGDAPLGEHVVEQSVPARDQQSLLVVAPRLRIPKRRLERDFACRSTAPRSAGSAGRRETGTSRSAKCSSIACATRSPRRPPSRRTIAPTSSRSFASATSASSFSRAVPLLECGVLLDRDAHQPHDHVGPVRGLTACDAFLGFAQLRGRAP